MEIFLIVLLVTFVAWKLNLFSPVVNISNVATRESGTWDNEHKAKTVTRYAELDLNIDDVLLAKQNKATLDSFDFDAPITTNKRRAAQSEQS